MSHRRGLANAALRAGLQVRAAARDLDDGHLDRTWASRRAAAASRAAASRAWAAARTQRPSRATRATSAKVAWSALHRRTPPGWHVRHDAPSVAIGRPCCCISDERIVRVAADAAHRARRGDRRVAVVARRRRGACRTRWGSGVVVGRRDRERARRSRPPSARRHARGHPRQRGGRGCSRAGAAGVVAVPWCGKMPGPLVVLLMTRVAVDAARR